MHVTRVVASVSLGVVVVGVTAFVNSARVLRHSPYRAISVGVCADTHTQVWCALRSASSGETMSLRSDNATYGQRSLSGITHRQQPLSQLSQLLPLANRDPLSWRVSSPLYHPCRCSVHRTSNSGTRQGYTPRRCRPGISCTPVPRGCRQSRHP